MWEYDERPEDVGPDPWDEGPVELVMPEDFLAPSGIPVDARRMGLDRNTQEGAMIALVGSLKPSKRSHKIVAWLLLLAFAVPTLLNLLRVLY